MAEVLGSSAVGNYYYLIAFIAAVIILVFFRKFRKSIIIFIFMGLVIANPWFKDLWVNKLHMGYYWRLLWIVPVIPLCAALPAMIAEKTEKKAYKGLIAGAFAVLFVVTGSVVYLYKECTFEFPASNFSKLPQSAVTLANDLLNREETPRVVADRRVAYYLREYDGKIHTMFGRNAYGYIAGMDETATLVDREINKQEDGDMVVVADAMRQNGYKFLISAITIDERVRRLEEAGFKLLSTASHWGLYELVAEDEDAS